MRFTQSHHVVHDEGGHGRKRDAPFLPLLIYPPHTSTCWSEPASKSPLFCVSRSCTSQGVGSVWGELAVWLSYTSNIHRRTLPNHQSLMPLQCHHIPPTHSMSPLPQAF